MKKHLNQMKKIKELAEKAQNLKLPANDKLGHFFVGTLFSLLVSIIVVIANWKLILIPVSAILLGIVKELSDKHIRNRVFSWLDAVYTAFTGIILYIILLLS